MRNLIDHYLLALRHEAHRYFPADRAEEIVTEIQTHLEDRVESNVRDGISRPVAEADAVKDFGTVRKLLSGFLDAAYETPFARRTRLIALGLIAILAICLACHRSVNTADTNDRWLISSYTSTWVFNLFNFGIPLGILILLVGGFLGRRPQTRRYALVWCGAVMLIALQVGTNVANLRDAMPGAKAEWNIPATIHRTQLSREMQISQKHLETAEREVVFLEAGLQTFARAKFKKVPDSLKTGSKYLLPVKGTPGLRRSALAKAGTLPAGYPRGYYIRLTPYNTPPQGYIAPEEKPGYYYMGLSLLKQNAYKEAVCHHWQTYGTRWLTAKRKAIEREKWLLGTYSTIEQSPGFNMGAVLQRVPLWFLPAVAWLALLLGTDFIGAMVGRFVHRLRREWEWRIMAARVR